MDKQMTSLEYCDFVVKQLPNEAVDQIIQVSLMNISGLIHYYIPTSHVADKKSLMFETLIKLVEREDIHASTKIPIVDSLFAFIQTQE
jgi:hypothetical protein